jgi:hypothetical protein
MTISNSAWRPMCMWKKYSRSQVSSLKSQVSGWPSSALCFGITFFWFQVSGLLLPSGRTLRAASGGLFAACSRTHPFGLCSAEAISLRSAQVSGGLNSCVCVTSGRTEREDGSNYSGRIIGGGGRLANSGQEAGGFQACSRWSSKARAIPPDYRFPSASILEGCQR